MDSLGLTDSRRRRTCTRAIFPLSLHPAKLPIVNGYLAYVAMLKNSLPFVKLDILVQFQFINYFIYKGMHLHFILYLLYYIFY